MHYVYSLRVMENYRCCSDIISQIKSDDIDSLTSMNDYLIHIFAKFSSAKKIPEVYRDFSSPCMLNESKNVRKNCIDLGRDFINKRKSFFTMLLTNLLTCRPRDNCNCQRISKLYLDLSFVDVFS